MAPLYMIFGLLLQGVLINCETAETPSNNTLEKNDNHADKVVDNYTTGKKDFIDYFFGPNCTAAGPSAMLMAQAAKESNKTNEEQLKDIKKMANKIALSIQTEMANLLSYALNSIDKTPEGKNKGDRKRRSIDTPMDSSRLVMRLLKHIKSNNEHQNMAIEKMMSAQEIADKFGIEFNPDPEIITNLTEATTEQDNELRTMLEEGKKNVEKQRAEEQITEAVEFVPLEIEAVVETVDSDDEYEYYHYDVHQSEKAAQEIEQNVEEKHVPQQPIPSHVQTIEIPTQRLNPVPQYYYQPMQPHYETQILPPVQHYQCQPVCQRPPVFFEPPTPFTAVSESCPEIPTPEPKNDVVDEDPEPELVGEEYEETVSSKVTINEGDEAGSAIVNHVMTYTLSEKAHFKKPEVDSFPEQVQYSFFLM